MERVLGYLIYLILAVSALMVGLLLMALLSGCALAQHPEVLLPRCIAYVDAQGYLRGRNGMFTEHGYKRIRAIHPFTYTGACYKDEGPPRRITVCLVKSGPDHKDMTTNIWEDEKPQYFKRYPGSYIGKCKEKK